jgi:hypothetical protein
VLAILFLVLVNREIAHGPSATTENLNAGNPYTVA